MIETAKILQFNKITTKKDSFQSPCTDPILVEVCVRLLKSAMQGHLQGLIYLPQILGRIPNHFYSAGSFMYDANFTKETIKSILLQNENI